MPFTLLCTVMNAFGFPISVHLFYIINNQRQAACTCVYVCVCMCKGKISGYVSDKILSAVVYLGIYAAPF